MTIPSMSRSAFPAASAARCAPGKRRKRRAAGVLTLELILTLPLIIIVVVATVEFALLLMAEQAVQAAAASGARAAAVPSASAGAVRAMVARTLEDWSFARRLDPVRIEVNGQPEQAFPLRLASTGDAVRVTVAVDATAVAPDLFGFVGLSLAERKLVGTYVARKE